MLYLQSQTFRKTLNAEKPHHKAHHMTQQSFFDFLSFFILPVLAASPSSALGAARALTAGSS